MKTTTFGNGRRGGFTLIELVVVIVVAGVISSFAIPSFGRILGERNSRNARDSLVWLAARARARAIQTGKTQLMEIDPASDRAWIVTRNGTAAADTTKQISFPSEFDAAISTADNARITVCYSPRGFAYDCHVNSPSTNVDVTFTHAVYATMARVRPLGQVERL